MKEQCERLDSKKIISAITPGKREYLSRLEIFESIDSTNTYLLTQGKMQSHSGWACFAEQQTQGRGRQGKEWFSPYATNIYCSLSWSFPANFASISALSIASAVMITQALTRMDVHQGIGLKWPNDILCSGRKLAGILLENIASPERNTVIIGIGLNLFLPPEKSQDWISVAEILGKTISRNQMAGVLLDELFAGLLLFQAQGLKPFLPMYRKLDVLLGKEISIHTPVTYLTGLAQGINEHGELLILDGEGKKHHFNYGEVSVKLDQHINFNSIYHHSSL